MSAKAIKLFNIKTIFLLLALQTFRSAMYTLRRMQQVRDRRDHSLNAAVTPFLPMEQEKLQPSIRHESPPSTRQLETTFNATSEKSSLRASPPSTETTSLVLPSHELRTAVVAAMPTTRETAHIRNDTADFQPANVETTTTKSLETLLSPLSQEQAIATTPSVLLQPPVSLSKYAYAFVLDIDYDRSRDDKNLTHYTFLYNVLVGTRMLLEQGAQANVVLLLPMAFHSLTVNAPIGAETSMEQPALNSNAASTTVLLRALTSLGVKIEYYNRSEPTDATSGGWPENNALQKFRILTLTQYRRVLFLDGHAVLPIGNLDYLLTMSDPNSTDHNATAANVLKENVVVMGPNEPATSGLFVLTPGLGEYERLCQIVQNTRKRLAQAAAVAAAAVASSSLNTTTLSWSWDEANGWGHVFTDNDTWECRNCKRARNRRNTKWNFPSAASDQGLLYHWTKYVKRSVSIVSGRIGRDQAVQNYAWSAESAAVVREAHYRLPFDAVARPLFFQGTSCHTFMCDYIHFEESEKPWLQRPPSADNVSLPASKNAKDLSVIWWKKYEDSNTLWWRTLYALDKGMHERFNFSLLERSVQTDRPSTTAKPDLSPLIFHIIVTKPNFSTLNLRSIESIFYFHPEARLRIHSNVKAGFLVNNTELPPQLLMLRERGYHIEASTFTIPDIVREIATLNTTGNPQVTIDAAAGREWLSQLQNHESGEFWYSHQTDLVRLYLVYAFGGIYVDTDVILVRPLVPVAGRDDGLAVDSAIAKDHNDGNYNCAVLKFMQKGNPFIAHALNEYFRAYNASIWDHNGPLLLFRVLDGHPELECSGTDVRLFGDAQCQVNLLPPLAFQPVPWRDWDDYCFSAEKNSSHKVEMGRQLLDNPQVFTIHMNNKFTGERVQSHEYQPNSLCDHVLQRFKVLTE